MPEDPSLERREEGWRRTYRQAQAAGGPDCPDPERLADLALGRIEGEARTALADHIVACRRCTAVYRNLLDLHLEATASGGAAAPVARRPARRPLPWVLGAAALLILAAGLPLLIRAPSIPDGPAVPRDRSPAPPADRAEPPDRSLLDAPPLAFEWPGEGGAEAYWVALYDEESTLLWESPRVEPPAVEVPVEIRARLLPGRTYYWRAFHLAGIEIRSSPLRRFTISP